MLGTFVIYWIIGLPLAWYLGFTLGFGPQGLWVALIACLTLAALWLVSRFLRLTQSWT
jgi:MATE family multidrug resistance protein